jgi:thioredoxin-dependent peroxiredoxin
MQAGDIVEDFEALDQHGNTVKLSELVSDGPVVLFFYPKAMTAGCTAEACHFRNLDAEFKKVGARAVGISGDSVEKQAEFDRTNNLGLTLLADTDKSIAKAFGAKRPGPFGVKRSTFVIGTDRRVIKVIASELNMELHADEALAALATTAG